MCELLFLKVCFYASAFLSGFKMQILLALPAAKRFLLSDRGISAEVTANYTNSGI